MSTLLGKFISETYPWVLHSDGTLGGSGVHLIYDGSGNASALSLGQANQGATITGTLNATNLNVGALAYPSAASDNGSVVIQSDANTLSLVDKLPQSSLENTLVVSGVYTRPIVQMDVSSQGTIKSITTAETVKVADRIKIASNPNTYQIDSVKLWENDWEEILITADTELKPYLIRGVILYAERITDTELTKTNYVNIRSSRRINDGDLEADNDVVDTEGHHCFRSDTGFVVGHQFTTAVQPHQYQSDTRLPKNNQYIFYIRDLGPTNSTWKLSIQAYIY